MPHARELTSLVAHGRISGAVYAGSLKDLYCVLRKHMDEETVRSLIARLMRIYTVRGVDVGICEEALVSDEPDFEDGIVRALAEHDRADYIVTRDAAAFSSCLIKAVDAARLLEIVASTGW